MCSRLHGKTGDTQPHAVEREIEDLPALIAKAGGSSALLRRVVGWPPRAPDADLIVTDDQPWDNMSPRPSNSETEAVAGRRGAARKKTSSKSAAARLSSGVADRC